MKLAQRVVLDLAFLLSGARASVQGPTLPTNGFSSEPAPPAGGAAGAAFAAAAALQARAA